MYAIFEAKGKQFRAERDRTLQLPSLPEAPGAEVEFDVLLMEQDGSVIVGRPAIEGARVKVEVLRHGRGDKIVVFKMKRRKGYRKKQGHRQGFTEVRIVDIVLDSGGASAGKASAGKVSAGAKQVAAETRKSPNRAGTEAAETATDTPERSGGAPEMAASVPDATDTARELADQHGVDLADVAGSGKGGRILKKDVEAVIRAKDEG